MFKALLMRLTNLAVTYKENPDVIFLFKSELHEKVVDMKLPAMNPFTGKQTYIYFKKASTKRQALYYYTEGTKAGEVLGG